MPNDEHPLKFKRTLCGAYYVETDRVFGGAHGIVITVSRDGRNWTARAMVRDYHRFVDHENLGAFALSSKTRREAAESVLLGLMVMTSISPDFAAWGREVEEEMDKGRRRR